MISHGFSFVNKFRVITFKQFSFYGAFFILGFVYQPNWVQENFWLKADFYSALPFHFPYGLFLFIYSLLSLSTSLLLVNAVKRNL